MVVGSTVHTDVLVIGGGGAGCRAAVAAHDVGARVVVVVKGELGRSGATVAPGSGVAWQAADGCSGPDDSPDVHFRNIIEAGLGMADPRLARILASEVLPRMDDLERWGVRFVPDPAEKKRHFCAYSCFADQPRAHCILNSGHGHAGDIVLALKREMSRRAIEVHEDTFVSDLIVYDGRCVGALGLRSNGGLVTYRAGAVVLAAGGARWIFPHARGQHLIDTTGDGYAMALRAGARLTNMEFAQFTLVPSFSSPISVPGSFWALFPKIRNRAGEDALVPYLPGGITRQQVMWERTLHFPFSCRDASCWLDIAVATETREGRGMEEGGLLLDFGEVDLATFRPSRPNHIPEDYARPVILPSGLATVRNAAHAINGGVCIDEQAQTSVEGLFAAGEVAAGPHGADRLGGGMVTSCQVFGARAGRSAAEYARDSDRTEPLGVAFHVPLARIRARRGGSRDAEDVFAALQDSTGRNLMVLRNESGLKELLARIEELRGEWIPQLASQTAQLLRRALEAENALLTAELMARAALLRQESRGSHFREDYPARDDHNWRAKIVLYSREGELQHVLERFG